MASEITGGKFDEGFSVSAAGYLFNSAAHVVQVYRQVGAFIAAVLNGDYTLDQKLALIFGAIAEDNGFLDFLAGANLRAGYRNIAISQMDLFTRQDISDLDFAASQLTNTKVGELSDALRDSYALQGMGGAAGEFSSAVEGAVSMGETLSWFNILGFSNPVPMVRIVPGIYPSRNTYYIFNAH